MPWVAGMAEMMREFLRVMKPGAHGFVWALPKTSHWTMCALEDAGFEIREKFYHLFATGMPKGQNIGKAIGKLKSTEAVKWEGWNTTTKPAVEEWILVRKPLAEKTIVQQVLKTGTGALNIDACRIEAHDSQLAEKFASVRNAPPRENNIYGQDHRERSDGALEPHSDGRWPATVLLTHAKECTATTCAAHCPIAVLDAQSGILKSGEIRPEHKSTYDTGVYGNGRSGNNKPREASEGGASRYFTTFPYEKVPVFYFIPKASPSDRTMRQMVPNPHPTAKSTLLMSWLNKLITPLGGIILDPFAGSGSTLVAAKRDGFQYIGIEQREDYVEIAKHRLAVV